MKKFSIRALLVIALALIMCVSLVACGDEGNDNPTPDNPNPTPVPQPTTTTITTKEYFNRLWEKSSGIGNVEIPANKDLAGHLDFSFAITLEDTYEAYENVTIGANVDFVLDRTNKDSKNTAIKARLYGAGENWVTVYFFLNDPNNLYLDYAGQNIKMPIGSDNSSFGTTLHDFIFEKDLNEGKEGAEKLTIGDLLAQFTDNMGADWDLNKLLDQVVALTGINIKEMLSGFQKTLDQIGLTEQVLFDKDGKLNIKGVLTSDIGSQLFVADKTQKTTDGDTVTYETALDSSLLSLVTSFIKVDGKAISNLSQILNDKTNLGLIFKEKNEEMDGFTIKLDLNSITAKNSEGKTVHPSIAINLNKLELRPAGSADVVMATDKTNYSSDVALDIEAKVDLSGITLDLTAFDARNYNRFSTVDGFDSFKLDGQLGISVKGSFDLINETNNKTKAAVVLSYQETGKTAVNIVEASFVNNTLAFKVNHDAKVNDVPIVSALVSCFGDHAYNLILNTFFTKDPSGLEDFAAVFFSDADHLVLNENFAGGVWSNLNIASMLKQLISQFMPGADTEADEVSQADVINNLIGNVIKTVKKVVPYLQTNNNLTIAVDNVGKAVESVGTVWDKEMKVDNFVGTIVEHDADGWLADCVDGIKIDGASYTDAKTFLKALFASSANVVFDVSAENGIVLSVDADVTKTAGVGITLSIGATKDFTVSDLSATIKAAGASNYYSWTYQA